MVVAKAPDMLFLGILVTSLTSNPLLPTIKVRQEVSRSQEGEGRRVKSSDMEGLGALS